MDTLQSRLQTLKFTTFFGRKSENWSPSQNLQLSFFFGLGTNFFSIPQSVLRSRFGKKCFIYPLLNTVGMARQCAWRPFESCVEMHGAAYVDGLSNDRGAQIFIKSLYNNCQKQARGIT